jgi:serine/threonine-protein kinase
LPASLNPRQTPVTLGDGYTLGRELGGGGMSRVFVAREEALGRDVVVKVLAPALAEGLSAERFAREIRLAAGLQEPHIVPVLAAGVTAEGLPWYSMPYVRGESLRARLAVGAVPQAEAIAVLRAVAEALEYAHAQGVVHRDIKPENVLLSGRTAVVTDFGIAKALQASRTQAPGGPAGAADGLTQLGTSLGTPAYMAPEQAAGDPATDHRADLYAWGVVAYELLAGRHPFAGKTSPQQLMAAHFTEVPAPLPTPPVPAGLAALVTRCLAKDPNERPASAGAVLAALDDMPGPAAPTAGGASASGAYAGGVSMSGVSMGGAPRRRALVAGGAVALVAALGLGGWALRTRASTPAAATASSAAPALAANGIAVLPFESLGDSADAYFADGITDAVRGRLTQLSGVRVIARASAQQYRGTTKSPAQIARELGVRYLLTGTVRWAKAPGGSAGAALASGSRVQVSPELVEVTPDGAAQSRWQESFDAELRDVFRVQGEIAGRAVAGMQVALGSADRARVEAMPVAADPAGYDLYLRGLAAIGGGLGGSPPALRKALGYFEQAVARDSSVAEWWARLAGSAAGLYYNGGAADPALAERARAAAERARALDPNGATGHLAMGDYYGQVRGDNTRALAEYEAAARVLSGDAVAVRAVATGRLGLGQFEPALAGYRQAAVLDPRSAGVHLSLARTLLYLRRYDEARASAARALALAPASPAAVQRRAMAELGRGDLAAARRVLADAARDVAPAALAAHMATFFDLGWVLDDAGQRLALSLGPAAYDDNRAGWGIVRAQLYAWRGDTAQARVWADTARVQFARQLRTAPEDAQLHAFHGLALAYLGRRAEAVAEAERGVALAPVARDAVDGPYYEHLRARTYLLLGERERALAVLERLVAVPYVVSGAWLRLDPSFAPLRGDPRFVRLTAGR